MSIAGRFRETALTLACALLVAGFGASRIDIHSVDWAGVAMPGSVCGATHSIQLHKGRAVVRSRRWPSVSRVTVEAGWNPVVFGNLDGVGQDEAALVVGCSNGGGTADGFLAYAQVIFTTEGNALKVIGVVTPKQPRKANRLPALVTVKIRRGKVIAREAWYGPNDGTCCPSGRTTTVWTYAHGALRAGQPRITHSRFAGVAGRRPAERCAGAISVPDAKNDTRSWTVPAPSGPPAIPPSADLRRFDLRATAAGVCVRWTTASPAPPGTTLVFLARSPYVRSAGGGAVAHAYGFDLDLRKNDARATFGLDRLDSRAPRVLHVRVGRTGSVVSAFISRAELDRPPANMPDRPRFPYRAFSFEARVLSVPDSSGNRRVDFWPQERIRVITAAYVNGHLCGPPCRDPRFVGG